MAYTDDLHSLSHSKWAQLRIVEYSKKSIPIFHTEHKYA